MPALSLIPASALAIDKKPKNYWANPNNRRQFFEKFANQRGFDPLDPIKWRSISRAEIRAFKVCLYPFLSTHSMFLSVFKL